MQASSAFTGSWADAVLTLGGLTVGLLFSVLLRSANYCVMGAISDWRTSGHMGRLGAAAVAAATTIIGAQLLDSVGAVDLSKSLHLGAELNWAGALLVD